MNKKIFLISEAISFPFNEGLRNLIYSLIKKLKIKENVHIVTKKGTDINWLSVEKVKPSKLFLNNKLRLF